MQSTDGPSKFLDAERLLDSSRPRPQMNPIWWLGGILLLALLSTSLISDQSAFSQQMIRIVIAMGFAAIVIGISGWSYYTVKQLRGQQQQIEGIGEMVQMRRWQQAAAALDHYLSSPARNSQLRAQGLFLLSSVLSRIERFEEAIAVQNHLLEEEHLDPASAAVLRVGRAMAMLREDHLFDADRAISELRRGPAAGSGPLTLVELYRDVKTGHPREAIELFEERLTVLRDQLGHRLADAYGLVARAYDLTNRESDARLAFERATLLAPVAELFRRYPEVAKLHGKYAAAAVPPEMM